MSAAVTLWAVVVAVGALNYLSRLSFIALFARIPMPPAMARALRFVPAAMLTAIVVPAVAFRAPGVLELSYANPKLLAALVAAAIAWRTRSVTATMAFGMIALWLVQWTLSALGA
jgi:branched-subunit amino acid transport protein